MALIYCHMREYDYKKITAIYTKFSVQLYLCVTGVVSVL